MEVSAVEASHGPVQKHKDDDQTLVRVLIERIKGRAGTCGPFSFGGVVRLGSGDSPPVLPWDVESIKFNTTLQAL
jgi:hypothetical protein